MSLREWFVRLWGTLRPSRSDRDLEDELRAHLECAAASGRLRERRVELAVAMEELRDRRGLSWLRDAAADVRYAARVIRQRPMFAAAALLSIGLGLGASAALFNIGHHLFLRSLPVRAPGELVRLSDGRETVVYTTYERLRRTAQMFAGLTVMTETIPAGTDIEAGDARHRATLQFVSDDFFDVLGVTASRGRVFHQPAPGSPSEAVAVISDDYWQRQYRRDPAAMGAHFTLRGEDVTIAGIAPEGFRGASVDTPIDLWMVFDHVIPADSLDRTRGRWVQVLGRLRPGASAEQAGLEATRILGRPIQFIAGAAGFSSLRAKLFTPLVLLGVVVSLLLVVIGANLANLSLAATRARQREFAVRLAIGASRGRLVRQLFTESLVVTAAGVMLALVAAPWIAAALLRYLPASHAAALPNLAFGFDAPLLVAVLALGTVVWGLMSAIPSLGTGWLRPAALKAGGGAGHRAASWTSRALIVTEVALCTLAIIVAALFVRTLQNLVWQDNGYDANRVLVADVEMPRGYSEAQRDALFDQLRARAQMLPGVRVAAYSHAGQLSGRGIEFHVTVPGTQDAPIDVFEQRVSPRFFEAMGTPLVAGRAVDERDGASGRHIAVVNEAFVRRFFPGRDPLGQTFIKLGGSRKVDDIEIVGVARDSKWITLREAPRLMFYVPYQQQAGSPAVRMAIRADGDLPALAAQLVREARAIDSRMLLTRVQPFHEVVANSVAVERLLAHISGAVGVFTLVIAAIGLYGVLSHAVVRRRREIGVRMALGAAPMSVEWMIVREALTLAAIGFALGVPAAVLVGGFAASLLFGLSPADLTASTFALAVLLLVTVAAAYAPARDAAMTDPMIVLREE